MSLRYPWPIYPVDGRRLWYSLGLFTDLSTLLSSVGRGTWGIVCQQSACWPTVDVCWVEYITRNMHTGTEQHYNDVIISAMASQITSLAIVHSTAYLGVDQRKHQSSASLAFVWGINRWPVNSPYSGPMTRKMFPFDDVIMVSIRKKDFKTHTVSQSMRLGVFCCGWILRDHTVYAPSQWETALQCNAVFHWLGTWTEWSLDTVQFQPYPPELLHSYKQWFRVDGMYLTKPMIWLASWCVTELENYGW